MEQAWSMFVAALAAVWGLVGWQIALALVAGAWLGDFAGRRYPNGWGWLRLGFKRAGDAVKDAVKG